jgi:hypothetical protein
VLLRILATREETLAFLPRHRHIILETSHAKSIAPGGLPRPAAPVEAFPDAGAPPPRAHAIIKACRNRPPPRAFFLWSLPFNEGLGETPIASSSF